MLERPSLPNKVQAKVFHVNLRSKLSTASLAEKWIPRFQFLLCLQKMGSVSDQCSQPTRSVPWCVRSFRSAACVPHCCEDDCSIMDVEHIDDMQGICLMLPRPRVHSMDCLGLDIRGSWARSTSCSKTHSALKPMFVGKQQQTNAIASIGVRSAAPFLKLHPPCCFFQDHRTRCTEQHFATQQGRGMFERLVQYNNRS